MASGVRELDLTPDYVPESFCFLARQIEPDSISHRPAPRGRGA